MEGIEHGLAFFNGHEDVAVVFPKADAEWDAFAQGALGGGTARGSGECGCFHGATPCLIFP